MPPKKNIAPIPTRWISKVVKILSDGDIRKIRWTSTAESEFPLFGFHSKDQAYEYCISLLQAPNIHGEIVTGMYDRDQTLCETWAFLGKHPLGSPSDVYVKIGLHQNQLYLNLFSLHVDRSGDLSQAIHYYIMNKTKKRRK